MSLTIARRWAPALLTWALLTGTAVADPFDGGRADFGIGVGMATPQGVFRRNVDGVGLTVLFDGGYRLRRGPFAIGGQLEITSYAHETRTEPFSETIPDVRVTVDTNHGIYGAHLWVRVQMPAGSVRPYAMALIGGHQMSTDTSIWGKEGDTEPIASSADLRDTAWSGGLGGGVQLRLMGERFGNDPLIASDINMGLLLDLRMAYMVGGEARYLPPGGVHLDGDRRTLDVHRSDTDMTMVTLGLVMTFGYPAVVP